MIKRVVFGYFCKNKKLLRCIEDSSLTRLWFRFIKPKPKSFLANAIDDHETLKGGIFVTRMMERWTIDDAAFDMHDLSTYIKELKEQERLQLKQMIPETCSTVQQK
ncbi:hypothetical protein YC2023_120596 [Brassica napus]